MTLISSSTKFSFTLLFLTLASVFLFAGSITSGQTNPEHPNNDGGHMFQLSSSSFQPEGSIPSQFTCEGKNISPELTWKNAPSGTKTFALIVHDPDAPRSGGFTHWVAYDLPVAVHRMPQGAPQDEKLPGGGIQGQNDSGKIGYMGPCPPSGTHRYYFYLYALDTELNLQPGATKEEVEKAIQGHILQKAELMGKYKKTAGKAA